MNVLEKLSLLILLASVVANAAPVQDDLVIAAVANIDGVHERETRSSGNRLGIPWHLDRIDQRTPHLDGQYNPFANGTGVDIYILADGIEHNNEEFGGRARFLEFFRSGRARRCSEFGTKIASLAAGKEFGVAKHANIYGINLLDCQLGSTFSKVIEAVRHVIKRVKRTNRRSVIAMPIIGPKNIAANDVIEEAVKENIVVVTAAGNFFRNACKYSPGSSPYAINVGATEIEDGEDKLYHSQQRHHALGTNFGSCVSLYAPGEDIRSINNRNSTGTSPACAIVTGAAALVLEKYPHFTPAQVKKYLIDEATDGAIDMSIIIRGDRINKLLYVGNATQVDVESIDQGSGHYLTIGDDDFTD